MPRRVTLLGVILVGLSARPGPAGMGLTCARSVHPSVRSLGSPILGKCEGAKCKSEGVRIKEKNLTALPLCLEDVTRQTSAPLPLPPCEDTVRCLPNSCRPCASLM